MNSTTAPPRVLVLLAHPDLQASRVHRYLRHRLQTMAPQPGSCRIELRDLYALYPDFDLDVAAEQQAAAAADLIVWQHPIHWYGMPALMKHWLDQVLALGWAYSTPHKALAGKDLWLVTSTGGPEAAYRPQGYNRHFFDAFLPPYEQTAWLCGLRFLPPLVLHGAHAVDDAALKQQADIYLDRLRRYPAWPELAEWPASPDCDVPAGDRPDHHD